MKKYEVEFYEDEKQYCPIAEWLRELNSVLSKENSSMIKKVYYQIERLENEGVSLGEPIIKKIDDQIWELRPIPNRIFFGVLNANKIVLLHHFRKKTNKTPNREIEQAKKEYKNWIKRGEI